MENRYRTILPVVGILLVLIVALIAFFVTRRIRNATSVNPSASSVATDLILPSESPNQTPAKSASPRPSLGSIRTAPITGNETTTNNRYTTALDNNGFRESHFTVSAGTLVNWINLGTTSQQLIIEGLNSGSVAPRAKFSYQFDQAKQYTISLSGTDTSQIIVVW